MLIPDALYANEPQSWLLSLSRLHDVLEEILPPDSLPQNNGSILLLHGAGGPPPPKGRLWECSGNHCATLWFPRMNSRFLVCVIVFHFPQTTCGSLPPPSIKSITYAVLIRVCKSNIKIIPWGNSMVQHCHLIFPFATLTRQERLKMLS